MPRKSAIPTELRALLAEAKTLKATERAARAKSKPLRDHRRFLDGHVRTTGLTLNRLRARLTEMQSPSDFVLDPWRLMAQWERDVKLREVEQAIAAAEAVLAGHETTLAIYDASHPELNQ